MEDTNGIDRVAGDCAVYVDKHRREGGKLPLREAISTARATAGYVWIGLQRPHPWQIAAMAQEFGLPRLAVEDALQAHQRPKVEQYDEILFAVIKPVRYIDSDEVVEISEIEIFVGPHAVVSVRQEPSDVLKRVRAKLDAQQVELDIAGPMTVLHAALGETVDEYLEVARSVDTDIAQIEEQVFGPRDGDHGERIYKLKREVMEFRRAAFPLRDVLERLIDSTPGWVADGHHKFYRDVHDRLLRVIDAIEGQERLLADVLQANVARVSSRHSALSVQQNEDMRKISAWAAIGLVPTAIAGVYGMNFDNMPELRYQYGYFVVLGVIATACTVLYLLFRRNEWL